MTYYATQKLYSTKIKIATFSAESLLPEERVSLSMHYSLKHAKQSWIFFTMDGLQVARDKRLYVV